MKRGSIELARCLCYEIAGATDEDGDMTGNDYSGVDVAEILSAEVERLRAVIAEAEKQMPVAWLSVDCLGERYLCFTKPDDGDQVQQLYAAPAHTDHPMRHFDRTCPACNSAHLDKPLTLEEWGKIVRAVEEAHGIKEQTMRNRRLKCNACATVVFEQDLLIAPSPFDHDGILRACPKCKQCDERFVLLCDEPECDSPTVCGWPTGDNGDQWGGYRITCRKHMVPNTKGTSA